MSFLVIFVGFENVGSINQIIGCCVCGGGGGGGGGTDWGAVGWGWGGVSG